ncbi:hypothetical protein F5Y16DRAFT_389867 [Xylariaceae sp. FL0255]|nr:hypothetical protein F5Y16DRAFT_389867 [Xylariaceae sp. FL0255]
MSSAEPYDSIFQPLHAIYLGPRTIMSQSTSRIPLRTSSVDQPEDASTMLPVPAGIKHVALSDQYLPTRLSPMEWRNINHRIVTTVNIVLQHNYVFKGPGPTTVELHARLGVALVVENLIRPIRIPLPLANPDLQSKIRAMAGDVTHPPFRIIVPGGGVWFSFKVIDLQRARYAMTEDDHALLKEAAEPREL